LRRNRGLELAASYVGAVVGAGFASGQEQVHFFARHQSGFGALPLGSGILSAGLLFVLFGVVLADLVFRYQTCSPRDFLEKLVPQSLCTVYDWLMTSFIFWSFSIMLAGSGMLFKQTIGVSQTTGILLTAFVTVLVTASGTGGLFAVNLIMTPLMVAMPVLVAILSVWKNIRGFSMPALAGRHTGMYLSVLAPSWPMSSLLYVSYNILLAIGVFASMGKDIPDRVAARQGGILGGVSLTFFLVAIQSVFIVYGRSVIGEELPMLKAASYHGALISKGYSLALWFAMVTTSLCALFALSQRFSSHNSTPSLSLVVLIAAVACLPAQLGFARLVGTVYPIIGYLGLPILGSILLRFLESSMDSKQRF